MTSHGESERVVRHWIFQGEPKTLCGRVPKQREVSMSWPVCKSCDRSKALKHATRTYTFDPAQQVNTGNSDGVKFVIKFHTVSVTPITDRKGEGA